jgi:hypothetical protein
VPTLSPNAATHSRWQVRVDTVEKVSKCLLAISLKETKLSYARQLIHRHGSHIRPSDAASLGCDNRIARRYCEAYPVLHPAPFLAARGAPSLSAQGQSPTPIVVTATEELASIPDTSADNFRPDTASDTLGDTVSPSVSGHQMHQFRRVFNGLLLNRNNPSTPRLLIHFDGRPARRSQKLFIVPPQYEIDLVGTDIRPTSWTARSISS